MSLALYRNANEFNVYFNMCIETWIPNWRIQLYLCRSRGPLHFNGHAICMRCVWILNWLCTAALCTFCFSWMALVSILFHFSSVSILVLFFLSLFALCFIRCLVFFLCCHCHRFATTLLDNNLTSSPTISIKNSSPLRNNFEQSILQKMKLIRCILSPSHSTQFTTALCKCSPPANRFFPSNIFRFAFAFLLRRLLRLAAFLSSCRSLHFYRIAVQCKQ